MFANVDNNSTIAREEIFGPVLSVIPAENEANAVEIANDICDGTSVTIGHNSFRIDFSIAFGGFRQSGIGRKGGTDCYRILRRKPSFWTTCRSRLVVS